MKYSLVSIVVSAYNHKNYIKECLDSILMQQTNFQFEIILGEDESNDGTREICKEYARNYPDKIKLFLRSRKDVIYINGKPTGRFNVIENIKESTGKYIAICEGDDYWTDPYKLQKQVDFLEANPQYGICFHNVEQINTFDPSKNILLPSNTADLDYTIEDYILNNKTATCSIVFKKEYFSLIPNWFSKLPFGDLGIILTIMKNSNEKGRVLKDIMGVYRIHSQGIHGSMHENNKLLIKAYKMHIKFTNRIKKHLLFEPKYKKQIAKKYIETFHILMMLYKKENDKINYFKFKLLKKYYSLKTQ